MEIKTFENVGFEIDSNVSSNNLFKYVLIFHITAKEAIVLSGLNISFDSRCLPSGMELVARFPVIINATESKIREYKESLLSVFGGSFPKKVEVILNYDNEPIAIGNVETRKFIYIYGHDRKKRNKTEFLIKILL